MTPGLNDGAGGWEDSCLRLDCAERFADVDRDDPELRAVLAPQMQRIIDEVKSLPPTESRLRLLARLADRGLPETNLTPAVQATGEANERHQI